jgi:hypothetical protein
MIVFWLLISILYFWQGHKKLNPSESFDFYLIVKNLFFLANYYNHANFVKILIEGILKIKKEWG